MVATNTTHTPHAIPPIATSSNPTYPTHQNNKPSIMPSNFNQQTITIPKTTSKFSQYNKQAEHCNISEMQTATSTLNSVKQIKCNTTQTPLQAPHQTIKSTMYHTRKVTNPKVQQATPTTCPRLTSDQKPKQCNPSTKAQKLSQTNSIQHSTLKAKANEKAASPRESTHTPAKITSQIHRYRHTITTHQNKQNYITPQQPEGTHKQNQSNNKQLTSNSNTKLTTTIKLKHP